MAYSLKKIANNPANFPPVQTWMTWVEDYAHKAHKDKIVTVDHKGEPYEMVDYENVGTGEGKLRHHYTLAEAKKKLGWIAPTRRRSYVNPRYKGKFSTSWAIYEWDEGQWVLRYEGKQGEARDSNPLFRLKITKDQQVHPLDTAREAEALAAVRRALERKAS